MRSIRKSVLQKFDGRVAARFPSLRGDEVHAPGFDHGGRVGPRLGVMGHADVFVVDGASHAAAADNGAAVGVFGFGGVDDAKGFACGFWHGGFLYREAKAVRGTTVQTIGN